MIYNIRTLKRKISELIIFLINDTAAFILSIILAYFTRKYILNFSFLFPPLHSINIYINNFSFYFLWIILLMYNGLYLWHFEKFEDELKRIFQSCFLFSFSLVFIVFALKISEQYSRTIFILLFFYLFIIESIFRFLIKKYILNSDFFKRRLLIIGNDAPIKEFLEEIKQKTIINIKIAGLILEESSDKNYYLGGINRLMEILQNNKFDIVFISEITYKEKIDSIIEICEHFVKNIVIITKHNTLIDINTRIRDIDGKIFISKKINLLDPINIFIKNIFDYCLSLLIILILLPLFILIYIFIRIESKGDAIFFHKRLGKYGKEFNCFKFRTMYINSNEILEEYFKENPNARKYFENDFKLRKDPRITKIGKILRKTSLDELPQFINILKGEMSLIGPRPIVEEEVKKYGVVSKQLFKVKPGLTGLWQVSGRNNLTYEKRVFYDNYYIKNWNLWLDIVILIKTIPTVLFGKGAY